MFNKFILRALLVSLAAINVAAAEKKELVIAEKPESLAVTDFGSEPLPSRQAVDKLVHFADAEVQEMISVSKETGWKPTETADSIVISKATFDALIKEFKETSYFGLPGLASRVIEYQGEEFVLMPKDAMLTFGLALTVGSLIPVLIFIGYLGYATHK